MDILSAKESKDYDRIIEESAGLVPEQCSSAYEAHAIGKAYEKKQAFSQSIPWYVRSFKLDPIDERFGMIAGVCLVSGKYDRLQEYMSLDEADRDGYFYNAAKFELAFRTGEPEEKQIEALEQFLDIQYEKSYMLMLTGLYLKNGREKEAVRLCKKVVRLFPDTAASEYAAELKQSADDGKGLDHIRNNPWYEDDVFKHLSFDLSGALPEDIHIDANIQKAPPVKTTAEKASSDNSASDKPAAEKTSFIKKPKILSVFMKKQDNPPAKEEAAQPEPVAPEKTENVPVKETAKEKEKKEKDKKPKIAPLVEKSMENVIGMESLKQPLNDIVSLLQLEKKKEKAELVLQKNLRIYGPDGCGKTTAAFAACRALCSMGLIDDEIPVITDYESLLSETDDELHNKIQELFENAENKCILIENIHEFNDDNAYSVGLKIIDQLTKAVAAADGAVILIITGREKETQDLLMKKRRFAEFFMLEPVLLGKYTIDELVLITDAIAAKRSFVFEESAVPALQKKLENAMAQPDFAYARDLDQLVNSCIRNVANRLRDKRRKSEKEYYIITEADIEGGEQLETVEELLNQLESMTGLESVKEQVRSSVRHEKLQRMKAEMGLQESGHGTLHMLFTGNAGTGKTTVARILGKIYKRLGVLPKGQLVECSRKDLISNIYGATDKQVSAKVKEAMGGILFIDEAYSVCRDDNDTYGKEAIETLLKEMEDHRDSFMVILAGYGPEMDKFLDKNQGLRSRIPTVVNFEDYTIDEMVQIFKDIARSNKMLLNAGTDKPIRDLIESRSKKKDFGNARGVRNVFEEVHRAQESRIAAVAEQNSSMLSTNDFLIIKKEDIESLSGGEGKQESKTVQDYLDELNALTGLASVKEQVTRMIASVQVNQAMKESGLQTQGFGTLHMVFKGNAGTGKTTVARIIGNIYRELGVLSTGQFIECDRSSLVGTYVGETAQKTKAKIEEALGGILFIDEAYSLMQGGANDYGKEAITELVADIENYRNDLCVIIAGYSDDMDQFLAVNQGLSSRFSTEIIFEDYTPDEMLTILHGMIKGKGMKFEEGCDPYLQQLIAHNSQASDFGNARGIRNLVDKILISRNLRIAPMLSDTSMTREQRSSMLNTIKKEDIESLSGVEEKQDRKTVQDYLDELNALTGLASVKEQVTRMIASVQVNQAMKESGLQTQGFGTLHMVFKGNAGTGKTTVARIIGNIYRELGVLSTGQFIECDRSSLVGTYVGETAQKTKAKIEEALGGILFIDEAYSLMQGGANDYGKEAITELVADIENYRNDLCVIIAGYSDDMDQFLAVNQGLSSRFSTEIIFEDYTPDEMLTILHGMIKGKGMKFEEGCDPYLQQLIAHNSQASDFGNARGIRNLVDKILSSRNLRIAPMLSDMSMTKEQRSEMLRTVTAHDIQTLLV